MRIALIGSAGQLGTALMSLFPDEMLPLGHAAIEIADQAHVRSALADLAPELVINAAAYNLVDQAEVDPEAAFAANAWGPRNLAVVCQERGIPLAQISTDHVFGLDEGRPATPYQETDAPGPVSTYGLSKLTGEYFVRSLCPRHFVVRTCGLYGASQRSGKKNFVEKMLELGAARGEVSVVADQHCTPTSTLDLARAIMALVRSGKFGVYHATNQGATSWYDFAREIFRVARMQVLVNPISSADFNAKARRPSYSVLDTRQLRSAIGYELPPWEAALTEYMSKSIP